MSWFEHSLALPFFMMDVSLSELWELVMNREAWRAVIHGVAKSRTSKPSLFLPPQEEPQLLLCLDRASTQSFNNGPSLYFTRLFAQAPP